MKQKKLKIKYQDEVNEKLEKEFKKLLKEHGWKFGGSGWDFVKRERDLAFYKHI